MWRRVVVVLVSLILVAGCASAPMPEERARTGDDKGGKVWVSDKAYEIFQEKGEVTAAFRGMSRDSELLCEHLYLKGSHRKRTFCYTRAERDRINLNHQEAWRTLLVPGAKIVE